MSESAATSNAGSRADEATAPPGPPPVAPLSSAQPEAAAVERTDDAVILLSASGRVVGWNDAATALYGYDEDEMLGRPLRDLDRTPAPAPSLESIPPAGASARRQVVRRHKDGTLIELEVEILMLPRSGLSTLADSPRHELQMSDAALAGPAGWTLVPDGVLETIPGIVFRVDTLGRVLFCAGDGLRSLGITAADILGVSLFDLVESDSARDIATRVMRGESYAGPWLLAGTMWQVSCFPLFGDDGHVQQIAGTFRNEQARSERNEAVARSEARFRALVQHSTDLVSVIDRSMTVSYVSPSALTLLGSQPEDLIGQPITVIVHPEDLAIVDGRLEDLMTGRDDREDVFDLRLLHADGNWRTFELVDTNLFDDPAVGGIVVNGRDVTDRRRAAEELRHRATHDPLTDLADRHHFLEQLNEVLQRPNGERAAVIAVGLDRFKTINDGLGHSAGDHVLVTVAERFTEAMPTGGLVARVGGDTFVAAAPGVSSVRHARALAGKLLATLDEPIGVGGRRIAVSASAGVAVSSPLADAATVVRDADTAMHDAKSGRAGPIALFAPSLGASAARTLDLAQALPLAVERNELRVHFQPIVATVTGALVGAEALVRWQHPDFGLIPPLDFIPLAEDTGDIIEIGTWVLRTACESMAGWARRGDPLRLSVNLSPRQLSDPDLVHHVRNIAHETGFDLNSLTLEVTEAVLVEEGPAATHTLAELRNMGISLAIDDFGTGYSSLVYLRRLKVDALKIDRSFVGGLGQGDEDDTIVAAIVNLARSLDLDLVAEGVETEEQQQLLAGLHCAYAQGYLFSRPLEHDAFTARYMKSS